MPSRTSRPSFAIGRNLNGHWVELQRTLDAAGTLCFLIAAMRYSGLTVSSHDASFLVLSVVVALVVFQSAGVYRGWVSGKNGFAKLGFLITAWWQTLFILSVVLLFEVPELDFVAFLILVLVPPFAFLYVHRLVFVFASLLTSQKAEKVAIVGMTEMGAHLARELKKNLGPGVQICGFFDDRSPSRLPASTHLPFLGKLADVPREVQSRGLGLIFVALPMQEKERIVRLLDELADTTASVCFVPDLLSFDLMQAGIWELGGIPIITVRDTPVRGFRGIAKVVMDYVLGILVLLLVAPLMLLITVAIKLTSKGPALFRQKRFGLNGKEIVIYKFRTMDVALENSNTQTLPGDPRVTRLGAFLRRTSLDEMPQILNVLQGRLSLVGPRPHAGFTHEAYRKLIKGYMLRHKVKPGLTGWAQVNGYRGATDQQSMEMRIRFDDYYLRNWSLGFDILILAKTPWAILVGRNAH